MKKQTCVTTQAMAGAAVFNWPRCPRCGAYYDYKGRCDCDNSSGY